jgi:hypothetical protein
VKKQKKYSLSRWAACGRDANWINTLCHRRLVQLSPASSAADWKQLLVYWGSDYRTHTTLSKWNHALADLLKAIEEDDEPLEETPAKSNVKSDEVFSERQGQLIFRSSDVQAVFLLNKGMALDCLTVAGVKQAFGTVHHGQFSHISYVADFYTGSSVIEAAGIGKLADLTQLKSYQTQQVGEGTYQLTCQLMMKDVAVLVKTWTINLGLRQLSFEAKVSLKKMVFGSIRLGTFTLKTDDAQAWYETHNGGPVPERYPLRGQVSQHSAASLLQSSHSGLGTSEGVVRLGCSASQMLELKLDQTRSCPFCLLESYAENGKRLTRLYFSLQELDDTLKVNETKLARDFYVQWQVNY